MNQIVWRSLCTRHQGSSVGTLFANQFEKLTKQDDNNTVPCKIVKKGYLPDREYYSCFQDCWGYIILN